ncbi:hypothetical protein PsorP6_003302 [Peronosclerospora sorghi]|uniref:Uncharacterized protein n=1 Tax=Peronosclerospora sorghi TaxID=230839 RepID=A0ACC0VMV6_9STRA|nr:hypothetical protein PsorP6_003302 [Peronosclerospora sorghi]
MATCNGNVSVYRPRHGDSGELLDYTQVAEMEIKEEIEALFEWPSDSSNPDVSSQLFARCSSGKFFSIRGQSSANAFHTQHINLLDGPPHDDDGITFVVGDIALDDERGMIALVSMNGLVSMLSSSGERKWSFQLPEAVVNADKLKMTAPSGKPADAIVACTWSGQVYVIQGEQKFVPFRMVLPSCSMFCVNIHDIVQISPTIVGISTSGTVLVYRGVQETLLRILQDFTLAKEVKRSAVFAQLDSPEKREAVLKKLRDAFPDSALSTETVAPSMEDVIKAMLAAPVQP